MQVLVLPRDSEAQSMCSSWFSGPRVDVACEFFFTKLSCPASPSPQLAWKLKRENMVKA